MKKRNGVPVRVAPEFYDYLKCKQKEFSAMARVNKVSLFNTTKIMLRHLDGKKKNRRAQSILQPLIILGIIFTFAIACGVFIIFTGHLGGSLAQTTLYEDVEQARFIDFLSGFGEKYVGGMFIFIFFGLILGLIITSFLVPEHPIYIIGYILMLLVSIGISVIFGNIWEGLLENETFFAALSNQPFISAIMNNLTKIALAATVLTILIIFGKPFIFSGGESQGGRL